MSDQTKVDMITKLMAAYLHGVTDLQQVIKAIAEIPHLNPTVKSWVLDEHGELDLNQIRNSDLDEFKRQASMAHLEYHILEGDRGFSVIATRGPLYEVNPDGTWMYNPDGTRVTKQDHLGRDIIGDRNVVTEILDDIRQKQIAEELGVENVADIDNKLDAASAASLFDNKQTVVVENMSFMEATLLQERADDIGINSFMRYNPETEKYSLEMLDYEFKRNTNFPDVMSHGERLMLDYASACSMPQVAEYMKHIDNIRTEVVNYIVDAKDNLIADDAGERYIVDINDPKRAISLLGTKAHVTNFGIGQEMNQFDIIELDLQNPEDVKGLKLILDEIGYENMEIVGKEDYDKYFLNFDHDNRQNNEYQHNQDVYKAALQCAYEADKELIDKNQVDIEIRNLTPDEKELNGKTPENDDHYQMIQERIPGSDIIIQDEIARTAYGKYSGIDVLGFSERFKTKLAEMDVCEAMEHVQTQYYTRRDHAEFMQDVQHNKEDALENPEQMYIMGTLEKNPAYIEKYDPMVEPEVGYTATVGEVGGIIDRNMNGVDDRIEGFLDYDGDHRDDRAEGEYGSDDYASLGAPGFTQAYDPGEYSTEWDSEAEPEHELGDFWS